MSTGTVNLRQLIARTRQFNVGVRHLNQHEWNLSLLSSLPEDNQKQLSFNATYVPTRITQINNLERRARQLAQAGGVRIIMSDEQHTNQPTASEQNDENALSLDEVLGFMTEFGRNERIFKTKVEGTVRSAVSTALGNLGTIGQLNDDVEYIRRRMAQLANQLELLEVNQRYGTGMDPEDTADALLYGSPPANGGTGRSNSGISEDTNTLG